MRNLPKTLLRALTVRAFVEGAWWFLSTTTVAAVVIASLTDVPLFYAYVGTVVVAAQAVGLANSFSQRRIATQVEHKLVTGGRLYLHPAGEGAVDGVGVGVTLQNLAEFPLQYEVTDLSTQIGTQVPDDRVHRFASVVMEPGANRLCDDNPVMFVPPAGSTHEARLSAVVRYDRAGRSGSLRYEKTINMFTLVVVDANGQFIPSQWYDAKPTD